MAPDRDTDPEQRPDWADVAEALVREPILVVAQRFGIQPGKLVAAARRVGVQRQAQVRRAPVTEPTAPVAPAPAPTPIVVAEPAVAAPVAAEPALVRRPSRVDPYVDLLGKLSDSEIAERAGVTPSAVQQYRTLAGIPPALAKGMTRRQLRPHVARDVPALQAPRRVEPAPPFVAIAPAPSAVSDDAYAWKVTFDAAEPYTRIIVARDAAGACAIAVRAGDVLLVERLERALTPAS